MIKTTIDCSNRFLWALLDHELFRDRSDEHQLISKTNFDEVYLQLFVLICLKSLKLYNGRFSLRAPANKVTTDLNMAGRPFVHEGTLKMSYMIAQI